MSEDARDEFGKRTERESYARLRSILATMQRAEQRARQNPQRGAPAEYLTAREELEQLLANLEGQFEDGDQP